MNMCFMDVKNSYIKDFCNKYNIKKLSLFGSAVRNELMADSDIDILIEFGSRSIPGFFGLIKMEKELSAIFNNKKIDLRTINDLSCYIRDDVVREAEVLYES